MILSILLIVILLGLLYINYNNNLHISKKILMLLVLILVCHGAMNNIKFELLQEKFTNMDKNNLENFKNMKREELTIVSDDYDDLENIEDKEFSNIRDTYQDTTVTTNNTSSSDSNSNIDETMNAVNKFNELTRTNDDIINNNGLNSGINSIDEIKELNETMKSNDPTFEEFDDTEYLLDSKKSDRQLISTLQELNFLKSKDSFSDTENGNGNQDQEKFVHRKTSRARKEQDAAQSGSTIIKQEKGKGISSIFSPQIIIKEGDSEGVYYKKSQSSPEVPIATGRGRNRRRVRNWQEPEYDMWSDSHQYYDGHNRTMDPWHGAAKNWNKHMDDNRNGRHTGCGNYETLRKKPDQNYQKSHKQFYPGYSYVPPSNWDVPQKRAPICVNNNPDTTRLPIGIADHGTPINALEVDPTGRILATEEMIKHTNVGSILPKFSYTEHS